VRTGASQHHSGAAGGVPAVLCNGLSVKRPQRIAPLRSALIASAIRLRSSIGPLVFVDLCCAAARCLMLAVVRPRQEPATTSRSPSSSARAASTSNSFSTRSTATEGTCGVSVQGEPDRQDKKRPCIRPKAKRWSLPTHWVTFQFRCSVAGGCWIPIPASRPHEDTSQYTCVVTSLRGVSPTSNEISSTNMPSPA
jgi:hypothetical protein